MAALKKYRPISLASVLVETGDILDAIRERIGIAETLCIPREVAQRNGLRKKEYSVTWNKNYQGKDGPRPVFIFLYCENGEQSSSLTWTLPMCIKVHNAIVELYNDIVLGK